MITLSVTDREGHVKPIEAREGMRLMEVLREFDWGVEAICGGMCSCATCHVYLDDTWLDTFPARASDEEELIEFLDYSEPTSRLSCQLILGRQHDGLTLTLAPEE